MKASTHVITVVKDDLRGLSRTVLSLRKQTLADSGSFRVLVVDSSVGHEIREFLATVPDLVIDYHYVKPSGVYSAMNTALQVLKDENINSSDSVIFLNAGDFLISETALEELRHDNTSNLISVCHAAMLDLSIYPRIIYPATSLGDSADYLNPLVFWLPHQGLMANWEVFQTTGFFNESFKIAADYEWIIRALSRNRQISILPNVLVAQVIGGLSNTKSYSGFKERQSMIHHLEIGTCNTSVAPNILLKMYFKEKITTKYPFLFRIYFQIKSKLQARTHHLSDNCAWCIFMQTEYRQ